MQIVSREIDQETYEKIESLSKEEQEKVLFPDGIPMSWSCGYGYYGHRLTKKDGKYYAEFTIGDSCD